MIQEAQCFAFVPPAIPGIGNVGGLQLQLEDRNALGSAEMQKAADALTGNYGKEGAIASMNSSFEADVPQYFLNIDREKAISMGLDMGAVLSTLSYYMGAIYVNDFVLLGRIWQVKMAAGERSQKVEAFAEKLREASGLPVTLFDERCTTMQAHTILSFTDTRGKKRKNTVDTLSAEIILQNYLDQRKRR